MKKWVGWSGVVAIVLSGVLGLSACGGGSGGTSSERTPQFVLNPAGSTSNAGSLTMGVSAAGLDANLADRITVFARLLDPRGRPLVGRMIDFSADFRSARFVPAAPGLPGVENDFPRGEARTDAEGIAQITLVAPSEPGRMAVVSSSGNLQLSGLIFVTVYDVGFIPIENDGFVLLPTEISVSDPPAGLPLQFVVLGGVPFTDANPPPQGAAGLSAVEQTTVPYFVQNGSSGIGVAEIDFSGRFPAVVQYTVAGRVGGAHTFGVLDAAGQTVSGTVSVEFTSLEITPESATLEAGQSQAFALTGGVPPYECSPSGGSISPTTVDERGGTFTFFPNDVARDSTFTILCTDRSGQTASANVSITPRPTAGPGPAPTPTPPPVQAARVVVDAAPPSLNGPDGGTATVTATVLDAQFNPLSGVPVLWVLQGQAEEPTPTVPSLSASTGITDDDGLTSVVLTVPPGTAPQFLVVEAETDNGKTGEVQVGVTSQTTRPGGEPASISSAVLRPDGCQLNQDGTLTAIISSLVTDANGNPVETGVQVDWGDVFPANSLVVSPSFTNAEPPCNVSEYRAGCFEGGQLLTISPQPGTATTCLTFGQNLAGQNARVRATVAGTQISTVTNFRLPAPEAPPTPTPAPTPAATPSPAPPTLVPGAVVLEVGQTQTFGVTGGVPPYSVSANGGTASPTTVPSSGGTFQYVATTAGNFTILVSDSNGQIASAAVINEVAVAIQVDRGGPLAVAFSATENITILGGGTPPYVVTVSGGLGGSISGSPLSGPGTFSYTAPGTPTAGQIVITDAAVPANTRSIAVSVP